MRVSYIIYIALKLTMFSMREDLSINLVKHIK